MKYDLEGICQDCMYLEKIKPLFEEKDKEIDRLNKENDYYFKMNNELSTLNTSLRSDRDRLNNIINELEKVFIECDYQHLQRKLKALKEE